MTTSTVHVTTSTVRVTTLTVRVTNCPATNITLRPNKREREREQAMHRETMGAGCSEKINNPRIILEQSLTLIAKDYPSIILV